jgi:hypothetical protein
MMCQPRQKLPVPVQTLHLATGASRQWVSTYIHAVIVISAAIPKVAVPCLFGEKAMLWIFLESLYDIIFISLYDI